MTKPLFQHPWSPRLQVAVGAALFCAAYITLNYRLLVTRILYRWAANDMPSVLENVLSFGLQALLLLVILLWLSNGWGAVVIAAVAISGAINIAHSEILGDVLNLPSVSWMLGEYRQLPSALHEFWPSFLRSLAKTAAAIGLLYFSIRILRQSLLRSANYLFKNKIAKPLVLSLLAVANWMFVGGGGHAAESNAYILAAKSLTQSYPARKAVDVRVVDGAGVQKIVWLVDESVAWKYFESTMQPHLTDRLGAVDYGEASSFSNCSAQSNAALRWGVNVSAIDSKTDLRISPSIWGYARSAGYATTLIDGQVSGAPQNLVWPPERRLIGNFTPARGDINTDRAIASSVNAMLKRKGKDFIYVVFRGAHYQYHSNYPTNDIPPDSPIELRYKRAIEFSKDKVFDILLDGVDRAAVAVFYTSDHGQVLQSGMVPHCNNNPFADEFSVPLISFMPPLGNIPVEGHWGAGARHSHSQIFSTTLILMGYPGDYAAENYDNPLPLESKRIITFGKAIVPGGENGSIDLNINRAYQPLVSVGE